MRAKTVNEKINFERGQDPKHQMGIGQITVLKNNYEQIQDYLKEVAPDDRDETIPMWQSAADQLGNFNYIGDHQSLEYEFPEVYEVLNDIMVPDNLIKSGSITPTDIPYWFENEDLNANYKIYSPGILVIEFPGDEDSEPEGFNVYLKEGLI